MRSFPGRGSCRRPATESPAFCSVEAGQTATIHTAHLGDLGFRFGQKSAEEYGMFSTAGSPKDAKPAVVDGQVVMLPTLTGLASGKPALPGKDTRHLWNALAAAVLAEDAFVEFDEHDTDGPLAEVIDISAYRRSHEVA